VPGATTTVARSCATLATHTFVHLLTVTVGPDASATLTGNPATLSCGGPDDSHYVVASSTETVHLVSGGVVEKYSLDLMADVPIPVSQLAAYLASGPESGTFEVTGPLTAASELAEVFHP
jgi:hypothetical protein